MNNRESIPPGGGTRRGPDRRSPAPGRHDPIGQQLRIDAGPEGQIVLLGPLDLAGVHLLRTVLLRRRADHRLVLDLRAVDIIQATGVTVLHEAAAAHRLQILARSDSAVASVLRICRLNQVASVTLIPELD